MAEDPAILLVAHGSTVAEANRDVTRVAEGMRARGAFFCVEVCYLDRLSPTIAEGIDRCVQRGARRILILPYFLSVGTHVSRDFPREAHSGEERHPGVHIRVGEPFGFDERLVEIALERADRGLAAHGWSANRPRR